MNSSLPYDDTCVSIITHAGNLINAGNVFGNYMQQVINKKELIIVHNNDLDDFDQWLHLSRLYPMVRIYQQSPVTSTGDCLNYCIERSIFENIALFHEEHSYSTDYLSASLQQLNGTLADLVGKRTHYTLCNATNQPVITSPGYENCFTDFVILPTFVFKSTLINTTCFSNSSINLDTQFCEAISSKGGKIYSTNINSYLLRSSSI